MRSFARSTCLTTLCHTFCLLGWATQSARPSETTVDYTTQVKPVIAARCISCHGALKQEAGLRLDTGELARRGSGSGPVIQPGSAAESHLLQRITASDDAIRMPPEGEPLTAHQIQLVKDWIQQGAISPSDEVPEQDPRHHWAFQPIRRPVIPAAPANSWPLGAIDSFIASKHQQLGLTPQDPASSDELVRRLYIDLVGVMPSSRELSDLADFATEAGYARLVDQLLQDPRHGERWGRHWMDIWRYSDWWGLGDQLRNSQYHMHHWRDWLIESLNSGLPYDEMLRLMLAADELAPEDPAKLRATGFLARNYFLFNRHQWMDETVEHVGKSLLGLTLNCAKCHDHKFDPIPQVDYYRMRAFFEPYHVRLDMVPGEVDLSRDGIPRVFDGLSETPTYLFVRGQESQPDKSQPMTAGIPKLFDQTLGDVSPVQLPVQSFQPERHAWVQANYLEAALSRLQAARAKLDALPAPTVGGSAPIDGDQTSQRQVAELEMQASEAAWEALQARIEAWHASWKCQDTAQLTEEQRSTERQLHARAIIVEQSAELARCRHQLADAQRRLTQTAESKKKSNVEKEVKAAEQALAKAQQVEDKQEIAPESKCQPLVGARWTATRFNSSLKDDPEVKFGSTSTGRRTALARWITDCSNPLTARVAVNHLWLRHMGTPLVETVFDFGRKGKPPVHAELLDWLAAELMESQWDMKHLHRLIVTSATYRLSTSSAEGSNNQLRDPDNLHYWRRASQRLEAEVLRDSLLNLANSLDNRIGGPSIKQSEQAQSWRRSLYFFHSNNERNLFLTTFDEAMVKECYRRDESIVPQQALALTNSQLVLDLAQPIAAQIGHQQGGSRLDDRSFVQAAFRILLGSTASEQELLVSQEAMDHWRDSTNAEHARRMLVWAILNHNDFVTVR